MSTRRLILILAALSLAQPAHAQLFGLGRRPPPPPPVVAVDAPPPPPDPAEYWKDTEPKIEERFDPLGDRRASKAEAATPARDIANGVEPLLYRLWGLQPLQTQLVRGGEAILELWVRPSGSVRQAVIRIIVRRDGKTFVQARAGFGCCRAEILRRVDINERLWPPPPPPTPAPGPDGVIPAAPPPPTGPDPRDGFLALAQDKLWSQPAEVQLVDPNAGTLDSLCVNGVSYDLTLVTAAAVRHLRRNCEAVEVGSIAPALAPVIGAALGKAPLFDYLFPRKTDFTDQIAAHDAFIASGGRLAPRKR